MHIYFMCITSSADILTDVPLHSNLTICQSVFEAGVQSWFGMLSCQQLVISSKHKLGAKADGNVISSAGI